MNVQEMKVKNKRIVKTYKQVRMLNLIITLIGLLMIGTGGTAIIEKLGVNETVEYSVPITGKGQHFYESSCQETNEIEVLNGQLTKCVSYEIYLTTHKGDSVTIIETKGSIFGLYHQMRIK